MSQSTKRDAAAAFPETGSSSPHKPKRIRKKKSRPDDVTTVPQLGEGPSPPAEQSLDKTPKKPAKEASEPSENPARARHRKDQHEKDKNQPQPSEGAPSGENQAITNGTQGPPLVTFNSPQVKRSRKRRKHSTTEGARNSQPEDDLALQSTSLLGTKSPETESETSVLRSQNTPRKTEQKDSHKSAQQKFVQAAQKDGLAVFSEPVSEHQRALVVKKKKTKPNTDAMSTVVTSLGSKSGLNNQDWSFSPSRGGIFIDQDPLVAADGDYLLLPTSSELRVYATSTSLLVRSLSSNQPSEIISCALSKLSPNHIYVARANGSLLLLDWTTNRPLCSTKTQKGLRRVLVLRYDEQEEHILLLRQNEDRSSSLVLYHVNHSSKKISLVATVLHRSITINALESYDGGRLIVASTAGKLLLGFSQELAGDASEISYTWRELTVPGTITALDAQVYPDKSHAARKIPVADLVLGFDSGEIMHYHDLLYKLIGKEKGAQGEEIAPRRLHWHRTAVNTVKWSRDRHYIISGGNETVLVVWQLDTNQKQFLPHLSTSILNLTVSEKGSEYAMRLGDNSVMILSTADLLPSTNISGPAFIGDETKATPMLMHPTTANRLLAAVSANAIIKNQQRHTSATLIQTFDIEANAEISRQATTRNVTTTKNISPSGELVPEPSVHYLALSPDGKWLATVDEWQPPNSDVESMYIDSDLSGSRGRTRETNLRFWGWNEDDNTWELVTRVEEPHQPATRSVLGLVANSSKNEFATIGSDSMVRVWRPSARHRNGIAVRNKSNEQLFTWTSPLTIDCGHENSNKSEKASSATLAFSDDGSTIAASWSWSTPQARLVHLINSANGEISFSLPDLLTNEDAKLAFTGRYLLCLSDTFCVYDVLLTQNVFTINLDQELGGQRHLAVNRYDGTVAISISSIEKATSSKLLILSIASQEVRPVFETLLPGHIIQGLFASPAAAGYVVVDQNSRVRTLRSAGTGPGPSTEASHAESAQVTKSLDSILGQANLTPVTAAGEQERIKGLEPQDADVSGGSSLDTVLKFISSIQAPSPAELFQKVAGAMSRRTIS